MTQATATQGVAHSEQGLPPTHDAPLIHKFTETDPVLVALERLRRLRAFADEGLRMPWGWKWRSHSAFMTGVVTLGIAADLLAYSIVVPVLPYRLQDLGYTNISSLTGWLLFAYSVGVGVGTFPIAIYFHRYPFRRGPLVVGVVAMEASVVLFMLAPPYWCMVIARFLQGVCSCVVWTVGLALVCENIDPAHLGKHLGFCTAGLSIGITIAPPIGGALYKYLGWHAPFVLCIIVLAVDLLGRFLILERRDWERFERKHSDDLVAAQLRGVQVVLGQGPGESPSPRNTLDPQLVDDKTVMAAEDNHVLAMDEKHTQKPSDDKDRPPSTVENELSTLGLPHPQPPVELPIWKVLTTLASLPRGLVGFLLVFIYGYVIGCFDATIALRVQQVWGKDADFVGYMYLIAASPAFFAGPIAGWLADLYGTELVLFPALVISLPFLPLMGMDKSLPLFIFFFAVMNTAATTVSSIASLEMATVGKFRKGVSELHMFAAVNLSFAISTAVGATVGGQIYDHVRNGWNVTCWIAFGVFAAVLVPEFIWVGRRPLFFRMLGRSGPKSGMSPKELEAYLRARDEESGLGPSAEREGTIARAHSACSTHGQEAAYGRPDLAKGDEGPGDVIQGAAKDVELVGKGGA